MPKNTTKRPRRSHDERIEILKKKIAAIEASKSKGGPIPKVLSRAFSAVRTARDVLGEIQEHDEIHKVAEAQAQLEEALSNCTEALEIFDLPLPEPKQKKGAA